MLAPILPLLLAFSLDDAGRGWLDQHAMPLASVEAGHGFDDLQAFGVHIGDARVVALGECTHGTREAFQLKHRLTEYLAAEKGFSVFGIEASMPDTLDMDAYVHGADLDAGKVTRGMGFWTWSTEEVRDMAVWMREQNETRQAPLQWWGFDLQNPSGGLARLGTLLAKDPALADVDAVREEIGGGDFAATGLTVPGAQAAGKKLVLTGRIRTKNVRDGWAGLWVRVDGPDGKVLGFDNMGDRGPRGTEAWETWSVEMDVPAAADRVVFGVVQAGTGTGWYDDLSLSLDGQPWTPPVGVDLSFDQWNPKAVPWARLAIAGGAEQWTAGGSGYQLESDGHGALRVESHSNPAQALANAEHLAHGLEARAAADSALALTARLARTVVQGLTMEQAEPRGSLVRDEAMAENVQWLLQHTDAKLVLWAHNLHVSRIDGWMGAHLADALGSAYVPVGFACEAGTYTAMDATSGTLGGHTLTDAPEDSVEHALGTYGKGPLILDLREATDPAAAWLQEPLQIRDIGAIVTEQQFLRARLPAAFDLLVYLDHTHASVQLPWPPRP